MVVGGCGICWWLARGGGWRWVVVGVGWWLAWGGGWRGVVVGVGWWLAWDGGGGSGVMIGVVCLCVVGGAGGCDGGDNEYLVVMLVEVGRITRNCVDCKE